MGITSIGHQPRRTFVRQQVSLCSGGAHAIVQRMVAMQIFYIAIVCGDWAIYVWLFDQRVCRLQGVRGGERELGLVVSSISKRPVCRRVGGRVESTVVSNRLATNRTLPSLHGLTGRLHIDILAIAETCGRLTSRKLIRGIRNGNAFIVRQNGRLVGRHTHRHVVSGLHRISVRTGTTSVDLLSLLNVFRGTCERRS